MTLPELSRITVPPRLKKQQLFHQAEEDYPPLVFKATTPPPLKENDNPITTAEDDVYASTHGMQPQLVKRATTPPQPSFSPTPLGIL